MTDIYLVRHGQAAGGASRMDRDFNLTETGRWQAEESGRAQSARGVRATRIYASKLTRARQTAQTLRRWVGGEIALRDDLIEHGSRVLLREETIEEAAKCEPLALTPDGELRVDGNGADGSGLNASFSIGGETLDQLHQRAGKAWREICAAVAGQEGQRGAILVVAHGCLLSAMMSEALGMPRRAVWSAQFAHAAFVHLQLYPNKRTGEIEPSLCCDALDGRTA